MLISLFFTTMQITLNHSIPVDQRLIVALDLPSVEEARALVENLGESCQFYKIGLELFMAGGYFEFIDWLKAREKRGFVDLKFFDVPETVARAIRRLNRRGITFATVHGNDAMMRAAGSASEDLGVLAVTVLTSIDRGDLDDLGFNCDVEQLVISRARRAVENGCVGVVASGLEAEQLRSALGRKVIIVTPGIRPVENRDDQKRVVTVEKAFTSGADYIVVGRPIRDADQPAVMAAGIQEQIANAVER